MKIGIKKSIVACVIIISSLQTANAESVKVSTDRLLVLGEVIGRVKGCNASVHPNVLKKISAFAQLGGFSINQAEEIVMDRSRLAELSQKGGGSSDCEYWMGIHDKLADS